MNRVSSNDGQQYDTGNTYYKIVFSHDAQYTIMPNESEVPVGWQETGQSGTREACLAYIEQAFGYAFSPDEHAD